MLTAAPIPRYTVQVLLPYVQALDPGVIHSQLLMWRDDITLIEPRKRSARGSTAPAVVVTVDPSKPSSQPPWDHFGFAIPTHDLPLLVHVFHASPDTYGTQLDDAHRAVNHATLLLAFLSVLDTVLASIDDLRTAVLHWLPAQRVLPFAQYRMLRMELGPCGPAINVRIAPISPTDVVADTVGLSGLGLPDLQAITACRDPAILTGRLVSLARSMFVGDPLDVAWTEQSAIVLPCRDALTVQLD
jgi:hypothetical protein